MKIHYAYLSILLISLSCCAQKSAITFQGGDRLGDKLFTYCRAKWLAHTHDLTFLCPPFAYKEELALHDHDASLSNERTKSYKETRVITRESDIIPGKQDVLYVMDFYMLLDISKSVFDHAITIDFKNDPVFLQELQKCIAPKKDLDTIKLPSGMPTIALHIRRGGGYDDVATCYKRWPTKFPPDSFYIDHIRHIASLYDPAQPLYIYLFTDDQNPQAIAQNYQKALSMPSLTFDYRRHTNYKAHVLDDMFAMAQFDYLIRSNSQYTLLSMILGNHQLIISPSKGSWHTDHAVIDQVWMLEKSSNNSYLQTFIDAH